MKALEDTFLTDLDKTCDEKQKFHGGECSQGFEVSEEDCFSD